MKYYKDGNNVVYALNREEDPKIWIDAKAVEISESEADILLQPKLTHEQLIEQAEAQKQMLITEANQKTQIWQTQLMLGIITAEDKTSLTEWMLYVQKVQAVDTSTAPDIIWPEKPE